MNQYFFNSVYRIVILGLQNFFRNLWLTLAALVVMFVAILTVYVGIILNTTSNNILSDISQNLKVSIYLNSEASESEIDDLRQVLTDQPEVVEVTYVDQAQAQAQFLIHYQTQTEIRQAFEIIDDENILPASLEVSVADLNHLESVAQLAQMDDYQEVVDSTSLGKTDAERVINRAGTIQDIIIRVSIVLVIVFVVVAALIIFNTIRMAIFSRREEIQIMRLVGAPNYFVRGPFLIEAGLYGSLAAGLAFGVVYGALAIFGDQIKDISELTESYNYFSSAQTVIWMFVGGILGGLVVGCLSCLRALQQYLKL
ncbi:MAG: permease-like cell division protein FtsX [Candidatus Saccharibacteria bacterium]|nr:permease-like cell division protein FtsX [Candidatus Saccharibacteria bacterium]